MIYVSDELFQPPIRNHPGSTLLPFIIWLGSKRAMCLGVIYIYIHTYIYIYISWTTRPDTILGILIWYIYIYTENDQNPNDWLFEIALSAAGQDGSRWAREQYRGEGAVMEMG